MGYSWESKTNLDFLKYMYNQGRILKRGLTFKVMFKEWENSFCFIYFYHS